MTYNTNYWGISEFYNILFLLIVSLKKLRREIIEIGKNIDVQNAKKYINIFRGLIGTLLSNIAGSITLIPGVAPTSTIAASYLFLSSIFLLQHDNHIFVLKRYILSLR